MINLLGGGREAKVRHSCVPRGGEIRGAQGSKKSRMLKELSQSLCTNAQARVMWKEPALASAVKSCKWKLCIWKQLNPNNIQLWTNASADCEGSRRNQSATVLGAGRAHCKWQSLPWRTRRLCREERRMPVERKAFCQRSCCNQQQSQE